MWSSLPAKTVGIIVAVALLGAGTFLLSACGSVTTSAGQSGNGGSADSSLKEAALEVPTIWCSTCKLRVEASARGVSGVMEVRFDSQRIKIVYVTYEPMQTSSEAIVEAIEKGGDKVSKVIKQ